MKLTYLSITLALAISGTFGAPSKKIVIPIKKNPNYVPNAKNEILKINRKYKRDIVRGEVPLIDQDNDIAYFGYIQVGSEKESHLVNFDTGSSDFWLSTTECAGCPGTTRYDYKRSADSYYNGTAWQIGYGDHSKVSGVMMSDTVTIGGIEMKNVPIYAANQASGVITQRKADGLVGLGFMSGATSHGVKTPFHIMVESGLIPHPYFGVHFGKAVYGQKQDDGEYIFGGYNADRVGGSWYTIPVDSSRGYWGVTMDSVKVGDVTYWGTPSKAIVDTGTSLLAFPREIALKVASAYNAIENEDGTFKIMDCDVNKFETLWIDIGRIRFPISKDSLVFRRYPDHCTAGFSIHQGDFTILGDTFMKNYYFLFDISVPQISIAPLK